MPFFNSRRRALLFSVLSATAQAGPALSPPTVALLAGSCMSCHGPHGRSHTAMPAIAGLPESRLRERLLAFRNGTAPDATIMTRLMKGYDEQQIAALARWFAQERQ